LKKNPSAMAPQGRCGADRGSGSGNRGAGFIGWGPGTERRQTRAGVGASDNSAQAGRSRRDWWRVAMKGGGRHDDGWRVGTECGGPHNDGRLDGAGWRVASSGG
jgi:hypothetical protein